MSTLPLANVISVTATRIGEEVVIHVEGYIQGFGGHFEVERSPEKKIPPTFHIHASPGNIGTPGDPTLESFVSATVCFDAGGIDDSIEIVYAGHRESVVVRNLDPAPAGGRWTAILNLQPGPGPGPALTVKGSLEVPSPQHGARLERATPQGINPNILLLHAVIVPPKGIHTPKMARVDVEYREQPSHRYRSVTILPDGIRVMVQEVQ